MTKTTQFNAMLSEGGNESVDWAVAETSGRRPEMQDANAVLLDIDGTTATSFFGVFDGHAGKEVAAYCAKHVPKMLVQTSEYKKGDLEDALWRTFVDVDEQLKDPKVKSELFCYRHDVPPAALSAADQQACQNSNGQPSGDAGSLRDQALQAAAGYGVTDEKGKYQGPHAGSTAVVALLRDNQVFVASTGDSRCLVCVDGTLKLATEDHKPQNRGEADRVFRAGLAIHRNRVINNTGSSLAMSRAIGDTKYKNVEGVPAQHQAVIPDPETRTTTLKSDQDFMVLASDGLFETLNNQQVVEFVAGKLQEGQPAGQVAKNLVTHALSSHHDAPGSSDNITVCVVVFKPTAA